MTGMLTRWLAALTVICLSGHAATVEGGDWNEHPENQWVLQSPREGRPAPNFPYEGSGDYDPYLRRWIHHAGHDGIPQGFHTFTVDLDTGKWQQQFPPTSPPGVCCVDGTNVFDIAQRRFVRFPGGSLGHGFQWSRGVKLKDSSAWLYDTAVNSWMNMRPPPYDLAGTSRAVGGLNSGATYDPNHEISLSFGGQGSSGSKNTLFAYDAYANGFYLLDAANPPAARDGRPRIEHQVVMKVIWFVLVTGCRWEDVPEELGCSGRTAHRRLRDWEQLGIWDRLHMHLLKLLRQANAMEHDVVIVDGVIVRAIGGDEATSASPVDRRKLGSKHTIMVDRNGVPLAIRTAGASASDHTQIMPLVLDYPIVGGKPGRPPELPDMVYADRGYDSDDTRRLLTWLGVAPRIAKRHTPHGSGLGKVRWVVERTISWLKALRRMRVRYDRLAIMQEAWNTLAASVICFQIARYDCVL